MPRHKRPRHTLSHRELKRQAVYRRARLRLFKANNPIIAAIPAIPAPPSGTGSPPPRERSIIEAVPARDAISPPPFNENSRSTLIALNVPSGPGITPSEKGPYV